MSATHIPTEERRRQVTIMACHGSRQDTIAEVLAISVPTLRKHYKNELDYARETVVGNVGGNLYRMAMGDSRSALGAAIFLLKTQGHWRETDRLEVVDATKEAIQEQVERWGKVEERVQAEPARN